MIEINLIVGKKPFKMPTIMGVDMALINVKMIVLAIVLSFIPGAFLESDWEPEINTANEQVGELQAKIKKLEKKNDENKSIQEQVDALARQEKKLAERLGVVKEIIKLKKNPMGIMLYLAKNIPDDVWIVSLNIENNTIKIRGQSLTYKSIGVFIENLKNSVFFNKDIVMSGSRTLEREGQARIEEFDITGTIARFE